jgi:hypothetical protein
VRDLEHYPPPKLSIDLARRALGQKLIVGMRARKMWTKVDPHFGEVPYLTNPQCGAVSVGNTPGGSLRLSDTYLGAQFRRFRTRLGAPVAIKAMAAKVARLVYRMLRYGMKYVDKGAATYQEQHRQLQIKHSTHRTRLPGGFRGLSDFDQRFVSLVTEIQGFGFTMFAFGPRYVWNRRAWRPERLPSCRFSSSPAQHVCAGGWLHGNGQGKKSWKAQERDCSS